MTTHADSYYLQQNSALTSAADGAGTLCGENATQQNSDGGIAMTAVMQVRGMSCKQECDAQQDECCVGPPGTRHSGMQASPHLRLLALLVLVLLLFMPGSCALTCRRRSPRQGRRS